MVDEDFTMKVKFYGTRGSLPVCAREFQDFGGNSYNRDIRINLLLMGTGGKIDHFKNMLVNQMGGDFFPITMDQMGAHFNFISLGQRAVQRSSGMSVTTKLHEHPGGTYSFRIERNNKVLAIVMDIEHGEELDQGIIELAKDPDLLVHEAQYTSAELESRRGWGHSSYEQAIEVAQQTGAKQLVMTHHDPEHDDAFLAEVEKKCQQEFSNCFLARELMEFTI